MSERIALESHSIELRMLALREHVPGLRAMAAERAMRLDQDLDFIDDVRLAVDEVCAIMLANCAPRDVLTMRLLVDRNRVEISAQVPMRADEIVGGLSLRVLRTLAHSLDFGVEDSGGRPVFRLDFCRIRPAAHF